MYEENVKFFQHSQKCVLWICSYLDTLRHLQKNVWQIWIKSGFWENGFCTMIKHLFTLLCQFVNFWIINWLSFHTLHTCQFCVTLSFPKLKMVLHRRRCNANILIHAKLWNKLTRFQTMHFTKCFQRWSDHWACCVKSQEGYYEDGNFD